MLFKQEDLAATYDPISEAANILNDAVYLTEDESFLSPKAIPVVENTRIGAGVVQFDDIERLAEENGADYIDAMYAVAEANEIDPNQLAVAVDEWKIIESPEIVNELANVVLKPMSPYDTIGLFTEACVDLFVESGDYGYLDCLLNELSTDLIVRARKKANERVAQSKKDMEMLQNIDTKIKEKEALISKMQSQGYSPKGSDMLKAQQDLKILKDQRATAEDQFKMNRTQGFSGKKKGWKRLMSNRVQNKIDKAETDKAVERSVNAALNNGGAPSTGNNNKQMNTETPYSAGANNPDSDVKETRTFLQSVKHYTIDTPRAAIAKAINKLREKYQSFERVKNANSADPQKKTIFQKILSAISTVLDKLSNLLAKKKEE